MTKSNFDKLPIAKQRVIIAKDLIARLDAKKFVADNGYFKADKISAKVLADTDRQVKEVFGNITCRGCEIGGIFAAAVDRYNALKLSDLRARSVKIGEIDPADMRAYLSRWFSKQTLNEIECAFEGWETNPDREYGDMPNLDFRPFEEAFQDPDRRMRLITENIIKNGDFKPHQILKLAE